MYVVVVIAMALALVLANQKPLVEGRWLVLPAAVLYLAGAVALGAFRTALSLRAIARRPDLPAGGSRGTRVLGVLGQLWLVAGMGGVILAGYGQWVLYDLRLGRIPLAGEMSVLVPFLAALLIGWLLDYPLYRVIRLRVAQQQVPAGRQPRRPWTRREYLDYNLRHQVLFVAVPLGLVVLATDLLRLLGPVLPEWIADWVVQGGAFLCAVGVFLVAPALIVRVWRTARLPEGPLRKDLLASCRDMKLNCRELLLWRSGGVIANAGVMGLIGRVRYVLLSDGLLEGMSEWEVKAVFAHEAGHILSHHLFYSMLFALSSATLCTAAADVIVHLAHLGPEWAGEIITLGLLGLAWAFGFGFISRRFERQSDVIAAWSCGPQGPRGDGQISNEGAAIFARSLEHVAYLNGLSPGQWNWRHGSIAGRVAYVIWLGSTGGTRAGIDRVVRRIKWALWAATIVAGGIMAWVTWGPQATP
jgi:Zn-dependent protease with chaperone function